MFRIFWLWWCNVFVNEISCWWCLSTGTSCQRISSHQVMYHHDAMRMMTKGLTLKIEQSTFTTDVIFWQSLNRVEPGREVWRLWYKKMQETYTIPMFSQINRPMFDFMEQWRNVCRSRLTPIRNVCAAAPGSFQSRTWACSTRHSSSPLVLPCTSLPLITLIASCDCGTGAKKCGTHGQRLIYTQNALALKVYLVDHPT